GRRSRNRVRHFRGITVDGAGGGPGGGGGGHEGDLASRHVSQILLDVDHPVGVRELPDAGDVARHAVAREAVEIDGVVRLGVLMEDAEDGDRLAHTDSFGQVRGAYALVRAIGELDRGAAPGHPVAPDCVEVGLAHQLRLDLDAAFLVVNDVVT